MTQRRCISLVAIAVLGSAACGRLGFDAIDSVDAAPDGAPPVDGAVIDGAVDAGSPLALPTFAWSRPVTAPGVQSLAGIAIDGEGNVYAAGWTEGPVDAGGGELPFYGARDVLVVSYDSAGAHRWSHVFGGTAVDSAYDVAADAAGNVYVTGSFELTINPGGVPLPSNGDVDAFLVSFDRDGGFRWAKNFGDITGGDTGRALVVDDAGTVYLTGWANGTVDFGDGPHVTENQDALALSFDSNGDLLRAIPIAGSGIDQGQNITVDSRGRVYVTGNFDGVIDLADGSSTTAGGRDVFLNVIGADGTGAWSMTAGSGGRDEGSSVAASDSGLSYAGGRFEGAIDFGTGMHASPGGQDGYVVSHGATGAVLWSNAISSVGADAVEALAVASDDTVVVAGQFEDMVDLGPRSLVSEGGTDGFVVLYDTGGALLWAQSFGGTLSDHFIDLAVAPDGAIYVCGRFRGEVDFGDGLRTALDLDGVVIKLSRDAP